MQINNTNIAGAAAPLSHGEVQTPSGRNASVNKNLASHYTSLVGVSSSLTVGKSLNTTLKWATLSAPARKIGNEIQGGYDSHAGTKLGKARYWTGAVFKGLANITGGASSATSGVASVSVAAISNLGDVMQRLKKGAELSLQGSAEKVLSHVPRGQGERWGSSEYAKQIFQQAKATLKPSYVQKAQQETLTVQGADAVTDAAKLARVSASSQYREMPEGYQHATFDDIPGSILAKREDGTGGDGSKLKLHVRSGSAENPPLLLKSDGWSALKVAVYKRGDTTVLSFVGTQPAKRPATVKSDVAGALGIKDSAFQDADRLVSEFKKSTGGKVEVIGHSLGGALAQYSGIKHGVKVTAFNSMGLHVNLRDRLADKLDSANVTHVNTSGDSLSQVVENGLGGLDASSQVGKRYVIADSGGHRMDNVTAGLDKLLGQ